MLLEVTLLAKAPPAIITNILLLPCVNGLMSRQATFPAKTFSAFWTGEWFLTVVNSNHVLHEVIFVVKTLPTMEAWK